MIAKRFQKFAVVSIAICVARLTGAKNSPSDEIADHSRPNTIGATEIEYCRSAIFLRFPSACRPEIWQGQGNYIDKVTEEACRQRASSRPTMRGKPAKPTTPDDLTPRNAQLPATMTGRHSGRLAAPDAEDHGARDRRNPPKRARNDMGSPPRGNLNVMAAGQHRAATWKLVRFEGFGARPKNGKGHS